ncbi:MAG: AraC family transcriptional regulator [Acidobacteria bacterium]|nr:MAG: AraC family transcriptional regulator [Acidobacteriota bacterium]
MKHEEDDLGIDRMIENSTTSEVPPDVEASLRTQLADFRTRIEHNRPGRIESLVMGIRLSLGLYRNGIIGLAGAAAVITAAFLFLNPGGSGEVYAAAAHRLQQARTLSYSIVLNSNPYVAVDFTHQAPGFQRLKCSWGLEVRADSVAGKTLILFHYSKQYLFGTEAEAKQLVRSADEAFAQFRSLPERADEELGEKNEDRKTLVGFRVRDNDGITDIWVDRASGYPDHVDITILQSGKPVHQMKIDNIRLGDQAEIDGLDMEPPSDYTLISKTEQASSEARGFDTAQTTRHSTAAEGRAPGSKQQLPPIVARIRTEPEKTVIVLGMSGPHEQHLEAIARVEAELKRSGVKPLGEPFGQYYNAATDPLPLWEVGFPVPAGVTARAPFEVRNMPRTLVAEADVVGPWGGEPSRRWGAFLRSILEQGYAPAGPAQESWLGAEGTGAEQRTHMKIAVIKAQ